MMILHHTLSYQNGCDKHLALCEKVVLFSKLKLFRNQMKFTIKANDDLYSCQKNNFYVFFAQRQYNW